MIIELTDEQFDTVVMKSAKPVVLDFSASWCGPCKKLAPRIEDLAEEMDDEVVFVKCDVEECPGIAAKCGIMNAPTLLFFDKGKMTGKLVGLVTKQAIADKINEMLAASVVENE